MNRPTSPVYQSTRPGSRPGKKFVKSGMPGNPSLRSGTPRTRLPSVVPKATARSADAAEKTVSQNSRQRRLSWCERNSIATPRRMSSQSTTISAR